MHGPRSANQNTRGRTAVAVRDSALTGAPRELQPFAKHANGAISEEWMLEGKFNGFMT